MSHEKKLRRLEKSKGPFPLGCLYITPGAQALLAPGGCRGASDIVLRDALARHMRGDWGEVCDSDWEENDFSLEHGCRILSAYSTKCGVQFWIITEADRSATTVLLPEEY